MGWHYILNFTCKILPEYTEFIAKEYLRIFYEPVYFELESISRSNCSCKHYCQVDEDYICDKCEQTSTDSDEDEEEKKRNELYKGLSKDYKDLVDIWYKLDIANFYKYSFENGVFDCQISKKVTRHTGDLMKAYEAFLKDIIVPISSEISNCTIESDDFGCFIYHYTDTELRGRRFNLVDMIKSVEHTFNEEHTEIIETRVVYKRSIKELQFLDLEKAYNGR